MQGLDVSEVLRCALGSDMQACSSMGWARTMSDMYVLDKFSITIFYQAEHKIQSGNGPLDLHLEKVRRQLLMTTPDVLAP